MNVIVINAAGSDLASTLEALGVRAWRRRRRPARRPSRPARARTAAAIPSAGPTPTPATWVAPDPDGDVQVAPELPSWRGWGDGATTADMDPEEWSRKLDEAFGTDDGD